MGQHPPGEEVTELLHLGGGGVLQRRSLGLA